MSQEATIIAVDDSDFMRNGDFNPSRFQAQNEAVNIICQSKRQKNPENTLGLLSLAKTEVLCTLTNDANKIYSRLHLVQPKGNICFATSLQIAHLALRHRQLRHQKMRVVCFVGSPISDEEKTLVKLAKRLKKENVNVDVINFGENEANQQKLSEFIDALNGKEGTGSHLISVPPGAVLQDSLISSPILAGELGGSLGNTGLGLGLDDSEDPDLQYALRVSMEDQRMRQEQELNGAPTSNTALPIGSGTTEEDMLRQALALSTRQAPTRVTDVPMEIDLAAMTEDEQIAYALEISRQQFQPDSDPQGGATKPSESQSAEGTSAMDVDEHPPGDASTTDAAPDTSTTDLDVIHDASFIRSVLRTLPGVDPQDEEVKNAIDELSKPAKPADKQNKDGNKEGN